jgi:uncharacterized protein YtpQ (UPF0354 family)
MKNKITMSALLVTAAFMLLSVACKKTAESANILDEAGFQQYVFNYIKKNYPGKKISKGHKNLIINMDEGKLGLANLYKTYQNKTVEGKKLDHLIKNWLTAIMENRRQFNEIKKLPWQKVKTMIRPQFLTVNHIRELGLASKPFNQDIAIGFVIDMKDRYTYTFIKSGLLKEWQKDVTTLYQIALANLQEITKGIQPEIKEFPNTKMIGFSTRDGYDAVRILLPQLRQIILKELGNRCEAAIPTRDLLIFWSKNSTDSFKKYNRERIDTIFTREPYPLTRKVFEVTLTEIKETKSYGLNPLNKK